MPSGRIGFLYALIQASFEQIRGRYNRWEFGSLGTSQDEGREGTVNVSELTPIEMESHATTHRIVG